MYQPVPSKLSYAAIREYAEKVGAHHNIYDEQGQADIEGLFLKLGGRQRKVEDGEPFIIEEPGSFNISLSSFQSNNRDLLQLGRAIGAYFLHYRHPKVEGYTKFKWNELDADVMTQANHFYATLAMPEKQFTEQFELHKDEVKWDWRLASVFRMSPQAVKVRAQVLGLIG